MNHLQRITFATCIFLLCFNGACDKNKSVTGSYKPEKNFYGTITDIDNKQRDVEDITIAGQYKDIRVYPKPLDPATFSTDNFERIDIAETKEIRPNHMYSMRHKGIDYVEIQVTRTDGNTDAYLITKNTHVQANRKTESGPITKVVTMDQLKSLVIQGRLQEKDENNTPNT